MPLYLFNMCFVISFQMYCAQTVAKYVLYNGVHKRFVTIDLSHISLGISLFWFIFTYSSFWQFLLLTYYAQDFARNFNILLKVKLYTQLHNSDIIHIIYPNCIYTSWRAIARLIISQVIQLAVMLLYGVFKCQFLIRPNVLIVLLEYIDLIDNMKQTFGRGYASLSHSLLLYFILSIATVTN